MAARHLQQEMMPDDAEEFAVGSDTTVKHHGELKGSSSLKRKTSVPLLSTEKEGEGESGASATSLKHDEQKLLLMHALGLMLTELLPCPEETTADIKRQLPKKTQQVEPSITPQAHHSRAKKARKRDKEKPRWEVQSDPQNPLRMRFRRLPSE